MPRPTKLTAETEARLVGGIRAGLTLGLACEVAGITPRTYQRWMASPAPSTGSCTRPCSVPVRAARATWWRG
jgi:hypothetical protein